MNVAAQAALASRVQQGRDGTIDLGTVRPGQARAVFGDRLVKPTKFTLSFDADGNARVNMRGALQIPIDGKPDAIITEVGLNLGTGWFSARGHVNNLPIVSKIGVVGNVITEKATAKVSLFGWTSADIPLPPPEE